MSQQDEIKPGEAHACNFTREEIAAFKTTFENGRTLRKGAMTTIAGLLVTAIFMIIVLGIALTVRAISNASTAQLIERATGLPQGDRTDGQNP